MKNSYSGDVLQPRKRFGVLQGVCIPEDILVTALKHPRGRSHRRIYEKHVGTAAFCCIDLKWRVSGPSTTLAAVYEASNCSSSVS